jgi:Rrf2 family nitric oxide-sensitive transcriptional repressor
MQLSKFGDYSFRVLVFAGTKNDLCTTEEVSKAFDISRNHLVKVVHRLEQLGFLKTKKGKNGGFMLGMDPSKILVGKVFQEIEQNLDLVECFSNKTNQCRINGRCRLKGVLHEALEKFIEVLNQYTLKDLLQPNKPLYRILLNENRI